MMQRAGNCARVFVALSLFATIVACGEKAPPRAPDSVLIANLAPPTNDFPLSPGEGRVHVDGGRVWYRVAGVDTGTPVILVHGGPGLPSYYLKSLEQLGNERPVVRYDQLGAGKSDALSDTSKMNIAHFVTELETLRAQLGYNKVHLLGHGWGATIATEYYRAHPEHVVSLTLASPFLDAVSWTTHVQALLRTLPDSMQRAVAAAEQSKDFGAAPYRAAAGAFFARYMWMHPVTTDLDSINGHTNPNLYTYLLGESDFTLTGTLKDYSATSFLKDITVPVLYTVGQFDVSGVGNARHFASMTPGARVVVIPGAAHTTSWDNPDAMIAAVREHLAAADKVSAKP